MWDWQSPLSILVTGPGCSVVSLLSGLVVAGEPSQTLVQTVPCGGAGGLDVPGENVDSVDSRLIHHTVLTSSCLSVELSQASPGFHEASLLKLQIH